MGAALLRSLGLDELVVQDEASYLALASKLASEPAQRAELAARVRAKMDEQPIFLDSLAASDACGDLLTTAYDELLRVGRKNFRANRTPLEAAATQSSEAAIASGEQALADGDLFTAKQSARDLL